MTRTRARVIAGDWRVLAAIRTGLGHRMLPVALLVPAAALALPFLATGLRLDDYVLLAILSGREPLAEVYPSRLDIFNFFDGRGERTGRMLDLGLLPWWTSPDVRVAFWRPLAAVTHALDVAAWPGQPPLMHLHSLLWFGALVVAVGLMYRQLMGRTWAAGLAALLYVIDDAHAFGVGWVAGRNVVIAAMLGAASLIAHDRWRRHGSRAGALLAPLALAGSLLAAEGAAAMGGYVAAHALCLDGGSWGRRLAGLVPAGSVLIGWQLLYSGLGYGVLGAAPYLNPAREPVLFLRALVENAPVMLLAQWGGPAAEAHASLAGGAALARWAVAVLALAALGVLLAPLLRRDAVARFWAVGQVLALVPTGASSPYDRYLFFAGLGAMGLVAQFVTGWVDGAGWRPPRLAWRLPAAALAALLVVLHGIVGPVGLVRSSAAVAELGATVEAASDSMPADPEVCSQLLIIPTIPSAGWVAYSFFFRTVKGQPIAAHTRLLSAGAPVELYRPGPRTLVVRWLEAPERMFRAAQEPMRAGERVELTGTSIDVTAVGPDGLPREARFHFDADLDSARLRWIRWVWEAHRGGEYVPFTPPAIGVRMRVE